MKGVKGFQKGHKHSDDTKKKISAALSEKIKFNCEMCGHISFDTPSHYKRKKRHFCSIDCYSEFRKEKLPKEEQHAYKGGGMSQEDKDIRVNARTKTNHAIRDGLLIRQPCEVCGENKAEAHHEDYTKPLDVRWLCFKHHRKLHNKP